MKLITVKSESQYPVKIGVNWRAEIDSIISIHNKILILAPKSIITRYKLKESSGVLLFQTPEGESQKSLQTVDKVWSKCAAEGVSRADAIIGIGGGATTDLAGFAASAWLRGVAWYAFPTTLAGMVDAAIGGKTGINSKAGKNLIGSFYSPTQVLIDLVFLDTLPSRDVSAGMAEVIKCGFIVDSKIINLAQDDEMDFEQLIYRSIKVKADVVSRDFKESKLREILNYGHTLGHAIEKNSGYKLRHGEAVSIGMVFAAELSKELAGINKRLGGTPDASGLMLSSGSMQAADNFLAKLNAGQLKGMSQADLVAEAQKLLSEFPEKMAQFNRALQNQLKKAGAAYKMQQVDITATIDKISLTAQQSIEKIDSEIQSINTAISNIGSDTPARIQLSMDAADLILSKELEKIEIQTQSKLDALSKLKLPDKEIASQKARIDVEDTMARKKLEQAAAERKQENLAQKTLLTEKLKLETISKMAEAQKGLIVGEGLVFDQQRQALDRIIRQAQDSVELLNLEKALGTSQRKLNEFNAQFSTQAKRESMTPEERLQGNALATAVAEDKQILDTTRERQKLVGKGVEAQNSYNNLLAEQRTKLIEFDVLQDRQAARDAELTTNRTNQISKLEQELNIQQKLGFLTDRQIQVGQAGIALARIEIERDQELANIARERLRIEELINQEKQKPQAQVATDFTGELSPVKSDTMLQLEGQLQGITEKTAAVQTKAATATQGIMRDLDITPRMQKYSDAFNGYFQSMGDAIENWAKTGKFNSKELFNSLISDLARYEIKLAMTALYANAIRPLFNSALSFFGLPMLPVGKAKGDVMMGGMSLPGYAMGGVFDQGRATKYARGGIVDQPVLFPMKKGVGLMGEAGYRDWETDRKSTRLNSSH